MTLNPSIKTPKSREFNLALTPEEHATIEAILNFDSWYDFKEQRITEAVFQDAYNRVPSLKKKFILTDQLMLELQAGLQDTAPYTGYAFFKLTTLDGALVMDLWARDYLSDVFDSLIFSLSQTGLKQEKIEKLAVDDTLFAEAALDTIRSFTGRANAYLKGIDYVLQFMSAE